MAKVRRATAAVAVAILLASLLPGLAASAQDESLELRLRRTFGYSWGGDVQGSFLMIAEGPADLQQVAFYVDDDLLAIVSVAPFQARLHTGDYPVGVHRLWAEGTGGDGSTMVSNEIQAEFVAAGAGWDSVVSMVTPILAIVGLVLAAGIGLTAISSRRFKPGVYGVSGGAICPRCSLPMSRHFLAPNLGAGKKLERCPHCGKWSRVPRASAGELAAAEARLLGEAPTEESPEARAEALGRQVDESRFTD